MLNQLSLTTYQSLLKNCNLRSPDFHVVLGSGFGEALSAMPQSWELCLEIPFTDIPGLVASTVQDHKGAYRLYRHAQTQQTVQFQMGRIHGYEGHQAQTVVQPVLLPRLAGTTQFILTNAAGGLLPTMNPGEAMVITDQVNLTGMNPLIGKNPTDLNGQALGPRFPDMGQLYDPSWSQKLKYHLEQNGNTVSTGIYLGLLGPSFETHAEVRLFAHWGMGAVGMSTVWEAIQLKHSGAKIAGLSLISNLGAGLSAQPLDHENIVHTCRQSAHTILKGIVRFIEEQPT